MIVHIKGLVIFTASVQREFEVQFGIQSLIQLIMDTESWQHLKQQAWLQRQILKIKTKKLYLSSPPCSFRKCLQARTLFEEHSTLIMETL